MATPVALELAVICVLCTNCLSICITWGDLAAGVIASGVELTPERHRSPTRTRRRHGPSVTLDATKTNLSLSQHTTHSPRFVLLSTTHPNLTMFEARLPQAELLKKILDGQLSARLSRALAEKVNFERAQSVNVNHHTC